MALVKGEDGKYTNNGLSLTGCTMPYLHDGVSRMESLISSAFNFGLGLLTGFMTGKKVEAHARKNNPGAANAIFGFEK